VALFVAARFGWQAAYFACAGLAPPAVLTGVIMGEPPRHREPSKGTRLDEAVQAIKGPVLEFFGREGALLVLLFILLHKIGDTLANLTFRLLFNDLGFSNTICSPPCWPFPVWCSSGSWASRRTTYTPCREWFASAPWGRFLLCEHRRSASTVRH
jgi:hypothetical protein